MPERLADLRVLIVDDNAAAREILQEALLSVAKRVDAVESAAAAIAALKARIRSSPMTSCSWTGACLAWTGFRQAG